jgi:ATP-binding cassette subfamily C protein CydD
MVQWRLASLWRGHWGLFVALIGLRVVVGATWIVQAVATARIFADLVGSLSGPVRLDAVPAAAVVLAAALIVRPVVVLAGHLLAHRAMGGVKGELRVRALDILVVRAARDPRGRSGEDHALVVDGVENVDPYLSGYLPQLAATILTVAGVGCVMIALDPLAGIAATLVAAFVPIAPRFWARLLARRGNDQWAAYQELQAEFVDSLHGMTTLVAFGAEQRREEQLTAASASLLARTIAQLRLSLVDSGLAALALAGAPAVVLITLAVRGQPLDSVVIFTLVLLAVELVRPLRDLAALWHAGYVGTFAGTALMKLFSDQPPARSHPIPAHAPSVDNAKQIGVRDLVVTYPSDDLTNPGESRGTVSLQVQELGFSRGMTAVVGATGAGKSTLASALAGLTIPSRGEVTIDGVTISPDDLLQSVAFVPQDPALLGGTVAEEIVRGMDNPGDVTDFAVLAGIGTDDVTLTLTSPVGEGGVLLSGGQRQRVAIARGLAQRRSVLILDEATSALDPAGEAALIARLQASSFGVLIAITHRLAVARLAATVVVIDRGAVIAVGRPDETLDAMASS